MLWFGAGRYLFSFLLLSSSKVFQSAFVPGLTSIYSRNSPSLERKLQGGSIFLTGFDIPASNHQIFFQLFGAWHLKALCFFRLWFTWWLFNTLNNFLLSGCFKILHFKLSPAVYTGFCISGAWPTFLQHFFSYHLLSGLDVSNLAFSCYLQHR